jgi:hypothetical protein
MSRVNICAAKSLILPDDQKPNVATDAKVLSNKLLKSNEKTFQSI